jgi:hydroxymethylglutaryl-CoA reductase
MKVESNKIIKGFSKLSKEGKMEWIIKEYLDNDAKAIDFLKSYWHDDAKTQKLHDEFIENTITNFYIPFGVAPNFLINDKVYCVPMAIEESSVVAASAKSATFWLNRGGFKAQVLSKTKIGHVHFAWYGEYEKLQAFFNRVKPQLLAGTDELTANMRARGGGILDIQLVNKSDLEPNYYQLLAKFETCDSMGANFINSCLEEFSKIFQSEMENDSILSADEKKIQIIMCILSNFTPECIVRSEVSCPVESLVEGTDMSAEKFCEKFEQAIHVAMIEPYRATTHNKGIFNGIDAVVIATGNDFRAVEACGHTYAARDGQYKSLTNVEIKDGIFRFWIDIPMALGTVGGLTKLHPMVNFAHKLLGNPNAEELMMITASTGLAQNFGAIRSLVTTGIQKGHMKMHLLNILNQLGASEEEKTNATKYFKDKVVTHKDVVNYYLDLKGVKTVAELIR